MSYTLAYYERLKNMTAEELKNEWQEETEERYNDMLEALPPIRWKGTAFMVGECLTHTRAGALYEAHMEIDGHYFYRPTPLRDFNPTEYAREVRAKFHLHDSTYTQDFDEFTDADPGL